jgi:hypothetical protein
MSKLEPELVVLPRSVPGRLVLGLLCAVFLPFSATFLILLFLAPANADWGVWLVCLMMKQFFAALCGVSVYGLIWAIAMPDFVVWTIQYWGTRLALVALIPFLIIAGLYLWPI